MPTNADPAINGRSSMDPSDLVLVSVLVDERTKVVGNSRSLGIELLQRATRDGVPG
jgi:hypothetical protein